MIARRGLLALLGGLPFMGMPQRPDQVYDPPLGALAPSSQSGIFRKISIGTTVILSPSNDTSGKLDLSNMQHFLNNNFNIILAAGQFYINATLVIGLGQYVTGAGPGATVIHLTSAAGAVPAVHINAAAASTLLGAGLTGVTVDISAAAASSVGVQVTNIFQALVDCFVKGNGNSDTGIILENVNSHSEQQRVRCYVAGCFNDVQFNVTGSDTSFDRGQYVFFVDNFIQNGNGISWNNGAQQLGGSLDLYGNFQGFASHTGKVMAFSGAGASLNSVQLSVSVEVGSSLTGPQTINFALGSNVIEAYGVLDFLSAGATFQASNNSGNVTFTGRIHGDATLSGSAGASDYNIINSGLPTGFSGSIKLEKIRNQDLVFAVFELNVTGGTTITNGETIASGLVAPWKPAANQIIFADLETSTDTPVVMAVKASGAIVYLGATTTPAGAYNLLGSGIYTNTQ